MTGAAGVNSSSHVSGAKAKSLYDGQQLKDIQGEDKRTLRFSAIITGAS